MKLYNGDCLMQMLTIPDKSIDMVLCDLPYGTTNSNWDLIIPLDLLWVEFKRISKDNTAIVLFAQTPFDKTLGCSNLDWLKYEWIWEKSMATGHLNSAKMPMKAHENILVFYKNLPIYNPQKTDGKPYKGMGGKSKEDIYGKFGTERKGSLDGTRFPRSVLRFDNEIDRVHPTQKPVALCEYLIRTYTNEHAVVLDCCMGSGTTGIAAVNTNRDFIGIEKELEYFEIAKTRINEAIKNRIPAKNLRKFIKV